MAKARLWIVVGLAAVLVGGGWARADVTVSINISGSLDEIIPILELLRDLGIGGEAFGKPGEPLRLNIHSVSTFDPLDAPAAGGFEAVAPPPVELTVDTEEALPAAPLAVGAVEFAPSPVRGGQDVLMTVHLRDDEQRVDTLVATVAGLIEGSFDLYDNGSHGDAQANDQVWTAGFRVPEGTRPDDYPVTITAFDPHGAPVQMPGDTDDPQPLIVETTLTIAR
jgi:hypothetical protein